MNATVKLVLLDTVKFAGYGATIVSALTPFVPAYAGIAGAIIGGAAAIAKEVLANAPVSVDAQTVADTIAKINAQIPPKS